MVKGQTLRVQHQALPRKPVKFITNDRHTESVQMGGM